MTNKAKPISASNPPESKGTRGTTPIVITKETANKEVGIEKKTTKKAG